MNAPLVIPRFLPDLADDINEIEPNDVEIADCLVESFGMTYAQAADRLKRIDFAALNESLS